MPAWLVAATPYLGMLNSAEKAHGIPANLLVRIAWQESHFRPDIISGQTKSSAGAVGLMQLLPRYFPGAGVSVLNDISMAAVFLKSLYVRFGDWQCAVAAYNWGGGNEHHEYVIDHNRYMLADMPPQTQDYIKGVFTDVPIAGALFNPQEAV